MAVWYDIKYFWNDIERSGIVFYRWNNLEQPHKAETYVLGSLVMTNLWWQL